MKPLTRRDFLKAAGAAAVIPWLRPLPPDTTEPLKPIGLGRVTEASIWAHRDPEPVAAKESPLKRDTVIEIYDIRTRSSTRAEGLRRIAPQEMTPLSPEVEKKRIEVATGQQMVYAYEDDILVFSTQCSSGAAFNVAGLGLVDFTTPTVNSA